MVGCVNNKRSSQDEYHEWRQPRLHDAKLCLLPWYLLGSPFANWNKIRCRLEGRTPALQSLREQWISQRVSPASFVLLTFAFRLACGIARSRNFLAFDNILPCAGSRGFAECGPYSRILTQIRLLNSTGWSTDATPFDAVFEPPSTPCETRACSLAMPTRPQASQELRPYRNYAVVSSCTELAGAMTLSDWRLSVT